LLRQLRPPQRSLTIFEGESLLNDASALLIYRLAVGAVAAKGFSVGVVAPTFLFAVAGSVVVGPALGWLSLRLTDRVHDVPTAIILQFVSTFGVWILADRIGLSGVLTMVCYAMSGRNNKTSTVFEIRQRGLYAFGRTGAGWVRIPRGRLGQCVASSFGVTHQIQ
jgi:monovalent cation/hydrogen antiporter